MMKKVALLMAFFAIGNAHVAAATDRDRVTLPSGNLGYIISCGDSLVDQADMARCYRDAGKRCPTGYNVETPPVTDEHESRSPAAERHRALFLMVSCRDQKPR